MGGEISASSRLGEGAEFRFTMPLQTGQSSAFAVIEDKGQFHGRRALVIDDNEINQRFLQRRLFTWGMESDVVASGQQGLQQLGSSHYDVIFCDMMMPTMDGLEFARLAAEAAGSLLPPMILVTSARLSGEKEHALAAGFRQVLFKPVRQRDMFRALTSVLDLGVPARSSSSSGATIKEDPEGTRLVLLAEDNPINARLAGLILKRFGFEVHTAENGREVIRKLQEGHDYAAILMDMNMPELDGVGATRLVRAGEGGGETSTIPIIAMTANVFEADRETCLSAGMNGYLPKPLRPADVEYAFQEMGLVP
tara:strand:- start:94 stop:1020 length:927 start_codon:yes stop_codon:yes gene_type:complete